MASARGTSRGNAARAFAVARPTTGVATTNFRSCGHAHRSAVRRCALDLDDRVQSAKKRRSRVVRMALGLRRSAKQFRILQRARYTLEHSEGGHRCGGTATEARCHRDVTGDINGDAWRPASGALRLLIRMRARRRSRRIPAARSAPPSAWTRRRHGHRRCEPAGTTRRQLQAYRSRHPGSPPNPGPRFLPPPQRLGERSLRS